MIKKMINYDDVTKKSIKKDNSNCPKVPENP